MTDAEFVEAAKQLVTMEVVTDLRQRLAPAAARRAGRGGGWGMARP